MGGQEPGNTQKAIVDNMKPEPIFRPAGKLADSTETGTGPGELASNATDSNLRQADVNQVKELEAQNGAKRLYASTQLDEMAPESASLSSLAAEGGNNIEEE